jgi:endoglucanase
MFNKQWDGGSAMEMSKQWDHSMRSADFSDDDPNNQSFSELGRSTMTDEPPSRRILDETQQSWLLEPNSKKKQPVVDFGCASCSRRCFWWIIGIFWACVVIIGLSLVIWQFAPKKHHAVPTPDNYTVVLSQALTFFDIQKCKNSTSYICETMCYKSSYHVFCGCD